jgi:O-antigen/teichoic acid export membrane protein/glycosyltransferase involved in cell wall biosynthesis
MAVGINLLFAVAVARILPPAESGVFFLALAIILGGATVSRLGTDFLVLRLAVSSTHVNRDAAFIALVVLFASVIAAVPLAIGLWIFQLFRNGSEPEGLIIFFLVASVLPQALSVTAGAFLRGTGKLVIGTTLEAGLVQFVALLLLLAQGLGGKPDSLTVLIDFFAASWGVAIVALVTVAIALRGSSPPQVGKAQTFPQFLRSHGKALFSTGSASSLFYFSALAPPLILAVTSGTEEVSYFSVAQKITGVILLLPALQITSIGPQVASALHGGSISSLNLSLQRKILFSLVVVLPGLLLFVIFPGQILDLAYGPNYQPAMGSVVILAVGFYAALFTGTSLHILQISGQERTALQIAVVGAGVWILLGFAAGQLLGASGISFLMVTVSVASGIVGAYFLKHRQGIHSYLWFTKRSAMKPDSDRIRLAMVGFVLSDELSAQLEATSSSGAIQTQVFSSSLLKSLESAGASVRLESFLPIRDYPLSPRVLVRGQTFSQYASAGSTRGFINLPVIKHLSRFVSLVFRSTPAIRSFGASHVLVYSVNSALLLYGVLARFAYGLVPIVIFTDPPGVVLESDGFVRRWLKKLDRQFVRLLLSGFSGQIVVSGFIQKEFFKGRNSFVLNGFVDDSQPWKSDWSKEAHSVSPFRIMYAGTLDENSGVNTLIAAVEELSELNLRLEIYGAGHFEDLAKRAASESDGIYFGGRIDRDQILEKYLEADLLVAPRNPKLVESHFVFPSKIHETMMTAVPVICTRMPAIPDEYFAFLVDGGDGTVEALAAALRFAHVNRTLTRSRASEGREYLASCKTAGAQGKALVSYIASRKS